MNKYRRIASIVLLVLMAAFLMADQNLLPPNYQQIMQEFGISETQMGFVSTIFVATSALITIVWGYFSDIKGRKKLLVLGVLLGEIPCFLTAFAQNYWELLALRLFTGIGIGSIIPIGYSLISDMFYGDKRGRGFSYIQTAFGFGTLFGMIMAGVIASWRTPFIYASVPNFILAPLFYIVAEEPKRGSGEKVLQDLISRGLQYTYKLNWKIIKKSFETATNILIFFQGVIGTIPWGVIVYWIISFLMVSRGMSKETSTFVLLILGVSTVIGTFMGGFLGDYFERKIRGGRAILVGASIFIGFVAVLFLILYPLPSNPSIVDWIMLTFYGILILQFVSIASPNVPAIISQVNPPEDRGTVFGVFYILNSIGSAIGPVLGGIMINTFEWMGMSKALAYQYTLIIGALFWIPCGLTWIWIRRTYPKDIEALQNLLKKRRKMMLKNAN